MTMKPRENDFLHEHGAKRIEGEERGHAGLFRRDAQRVLTDTLHGEQHQRTRGRDGRSPDGGARRAGKRTGRGTTGARRAMVVAPELDDVGADGDEQQEEPRVVLH
jgi:hypothetical protein